MEKRTFASLYRKRLNEPSPAAKFVREIAELTHRSEQSVRKWIAGECTPELKVMLILERHFNIPFDELFPIKADE